MPQANWEWLYRQELRTSVMGCTATSENSELCRALSGFRGHIAPPKRPQQHRISHLRLASFIAVLYNSLARVAEPGRAAPIEKTVQTHFGYCPFLFVG
jgi:hypothetical protein